MHIAELIERLRDKVAWPPENAAKPQECRPQRLRLVPLDRKPEVLSFNFITDR
jgi:hypothetical protein